MENKKDTSALQTIGDIEAQMLALRDDVRNGTISPAQAHLEMKIYNGVLASRKLRLDHARLTGRLISGSNVIPDVTAGGLVAGEATKALT